MLIGAFEEESGEVILPKVKESLTRSRAEENMCPANTPGLYSKDEQSGIPEKKMDRDMMVNILDKYCSRWYPTPERWRTVGMLIFLDEVEDKRLDALIRSAREVCEFLKAKTERNTRPFHQHASSCGRWGKRR